MVLIINFTESSSPSRVSFVAWNLHYSFGKTLQVRRYYERSTLKCLRSKFCNMLCEETALLSQTARAVIRSAVYLFKILC